MPASFNWVNYSDNTFTAGTSANIGSSAAVFANGSFTAGDILIAALALGSGSTTVTGPSGWTQLGSTIVDSAPSTVTFWYKIATGSETGSYPVSWTGGTLLYGWVLESFTGTGAIDGTPDVASVSTGGGTGFTTANVITTGATGVMTLIAWNIAFIPYTNPGDMTSRASGVAQGSSNFALMIADRTLSAPGTYNETTTGSGNFRLYEYGLIAMSSAAAAATTVLMGQACL